MIHRLYHQLMHQKSLNLITNLVQWLCFGLSFLLPAAFATSVTLNHFYVSGGLVLDSGWFVYLSTHASSWPLANPPLLGGSFFSVHISPTFYLYTAIYKILAWAGLSVPPAVFLSLSQGLWHGLISLAAYSLFIPLPEKRKWHHIGLAFLLALFVMANGVSVSMIVFPHFEIGVAALLLTFFALWSNGYKKLCYLPLVIGVMMREDAGLHYFGAFILLATTFHFFEKTKAFKHYTPYFLRLACLCLLYSIGAIALQTLWFHPDAFTRIYSGLPPFQHLSGDFIKERLHFISRQRTYIYAPLVTLTALACLRKNALQAFGPCCVIPWIILAISAINVSAGTLAFYHAFPILIVFLWPAICYGLTKHTNIPKYSFITCWRDASIIMVLSTALFWLLPRAISHDYLKEAFQFKWHHSVKQNQQALNTVFSTNLLGEHFLVDNAVAAIEIDKINAINFSEQVHSLSKNELKKIDLFLFLPNAIHDKEETRKTLQQLNLSITCALQDSDYQIAKKPGTHPELC